MDEIKALIDPHGAMVEEWMSKRNKPFSIRIIGSFSAKDGDGSTLYYEDRYLNVSQEDIDCITSYERRTRNSEEDPDSYSTDYSLFFSEPRDDQAKALNERLKVELTEGYSDVSNVELSDILSPFIKVYRFSVLSIARDSTSLSVKDVRTINLAMSDADYATLLTAILDDRDLDFCQLAVKCPEVYAHLYEQVVYDEFCLHEEVDSPFIIFFDELQEDAYTIAGEPPFKGIIFASETKYPTLLSLRKVELRIEDKKVTVLSVAVPSEGIYVDKIYSLYDIPAEPFMKALGAKTSDEALHIMRERFGAPDIMDKVEDFLIESSIAYSSYVNSNDACSYERVEWNYEEYLLGAPPTPALKEVLDFIKSN